MKNFLRLIAQDFQKLQFFLSSKNIFYKIKGQKSLYVSFLLNFENPKTRQILPKPEKYYMKFGCRNLVDS